MTALFGRDICCCHSFR